MYGSVPFKWRSHKFRTFFLHFSPVCPHLNGKVSIFRVCIVSQCMIIDYWCRIPGTYTLRLISFPSFPFSFRLASTLHYVCVENCRLCGLFAPFLDCSAQPSTFSVDGCWSCFVLSLVAVAIHLISITVHR